MGSLSERERHDLEDFAYEAAFDALDCNSLASGDVDVMNTTLQQVFPCLDDIKVLASIGSERIPLTPDAPTVGELIPELDLGPLERHQQEGGDPAMFSA